MQFTEAISKLLEYGYKPKRERDGGTTTGLSIKVEGGHDGADEGRIRFILPAQYDVFSIRNTVFVVPKQKSKQ